MPDQEDKKKDKTADFLATARKRFELCEEAENDNRDAALDDLKFRAGDQWPARIRADRDRKRKPCLTINVLPARERQILNDQRQNRPSIHVNPVDDKADPETADILSGIVRHIWYDSDADVAIDTAFAAAVRGGFGYVRVNLEYENPTSFDQCVKIDTVPNQFTVYLDANAKKADKSDARFGFQFEYLTKEEYKEQFPDSDVASRLDDWKSLGDDAPNWYDADKGVRVAEYFYVENEKHTLCLYEDGSTRLKDGEDDEEEGAAAGPDGYSPRPNKASRGKIVDERETTISKVKWCKTNGIEILDETEWIGKWIPIVPVYGDKLEIDGKTVLEGMIRHTKDAVRMNNYMASAVVQTIGIAPQSPWLAAVGQTEDATVKKEWEESNVEPHLLRYNPVAANGSLVPPPQRIVAEPPIQAISQARAMFAEDLRDITGIQEAQYGAPSNEKSGIAIQARKAQGELSNFHYTDNLTRSIRFLGRQVIDLIPKVYTKKRVMRIIGEDGTADQVMIGPGGQQEQGVDKVYDITVGTYDVTVSSGPSYQTKRQEAAGSMTEMVKAYPDLAATHMDLIANNMDWAGAREFAERSEKVINMRFPGLIDQEDQQQIPPQAQQLIQQKTLEAQALNEHAKQVEGELAQLQQEKAAKVVDNEYAIQLEKLKHQGDMELELLKMENQREIAEITAKAQDQRERMKLAVDLDEKERVRQHEYAMSAVDHEQNKELTDQKQAGAESLASQQAQSQQELADQQAANAAAQSAQDHSQSLEAQAASPDEG